MKHRVYLTYDRNRYIITLDGNGLVSAPQKMHLTIESVIRGRPFRIERDGEGTINGLKLWAKEFADKENPGERATWEQFMFSENAGVYAGGSSARTIAMNELISEFGEATKERLESNKEPEVIALCGGLENALAVLKYCELMKRQFGNES
jgi:hypothetical protein